MYKNAMWACDMFHTVQYAVIQLTSSALSPSDFGYYRPENSSECVEQEELKGHSLEFCLNGNTEQLQTSGWGCHFLLWIIATISHSSSSKKWKVQFKGVTKL